MLFPLQRHHETFPNVPNKQTHTGMGTETRQEYRQDIILAVAYLIIAVLAGFKVQQHQFQVEGGGKVLTAFYGLIFATAFVRSVWFFIPSSVLEPSYAPTPVVAYNGPWIGVFISEVLVVLGSLGLYSIFVLIVTFWSSIVRRINKESVKPSKPFKTFGIAMALLAASEAVNILFFLCKVYNSQSMILYDSILLSIISLSTLIQISFFSHKFRGVLHQVGSINQYQTTYQVRRILWATVAANMFFLVRVSLEVAFAITLLYLWKANHSFRAVIDDTYWDVYINIKHWSEVGILSLMLLITTFKPAPRTDRSQYSGI